MEVRGITLAQDMCDFLICFKGFFVPLVSLLLSAYHFQHALILMHPCVHMYAL